MKHVTVYREPGEYAGWPANYGIWNWGDEIVTGFTLGFHSNEGGFHYRDKERPFVTMQSRSIDGGFTWESIQAPLSAPGNVAISADEHMNLEFGPVHLRSNPPKAFDKVINFSKPDF
ncbi:MAG TPA: exo-alpha-sialidase, partial [Dehalococcoidia bacterium]|nr:exo-alpha-sialidase [Dehalococcoidia bacterium]